MVEKSALKQLARWNGALDEALADAFAALASGEHQDAERRAKAVSALAKAARDAAELAEHMRALPPEEDVEALRAEVRQRLARFVEAERAGSVFESAEPVGDQAVP